MKEFRYSGEDIIYSVKIVDTIGTTVDFINATSVLFEFINPIGVVIQRTKEAGGVFLGDVSNEYRAELQEVDTIALGIGCITVRITIVLPNADFTDGEATSIFETKFNLV